MAVEGEMLTWAWGGGRDSRKSHAEEEGGHSVFPKVRPTEHSLNNFSIRKGSRSSKFEKHWVEHHPTSVPRVLLGAVALCVAGHSGSQTYLPRSRAGLGPSVSKGGWRLIYPGYDTGLSLVRSGGGRAKRTRQFLRSKSFHTFTRNGHGHF